MAKSPRIVYPVEFKDRTLYRRLQRHAKQKQKPLSVNQQIIQYIEAGLVAEGCPPPTIKRKAS